MHRQIIELPQEFFVQREVYPFPRLERSVLERIPPGAVILASRRSTHKRMIEVIWQDKQYIVFERDIQERMEPLKKPEIEDDPRPAMRSAKEQSPSASGSREQRQSLPKKLRWNLSRHIIITPGHCSGATPGVQWLQPQGGPSCPRPPLSTSLVVFLILGVVGGIS